MKWWLRLDDTEFSGREFVAVWAIATLTYGAGDIVTTLSLWRVPHLVEANALMATAVDEFGQAGIIALKLAVFGVALAVSLWGARTGDRFNVYFPPAMLTVLGTFTTVYNLRLLIG